MRYCRSPHITVHAREDLWSRDQDAKNVPDAGSESIPQTGALAVVPNLRFQEIVLREWADDDLKAHRARSSRARTSSQELPVSGLSSRS